MRERNASENWKKAGRMNGNFFMYLFHNKQGTHIAHNILLNVYTYLNKELYFFEEREIF